MRMRAITAAATAAAAVAGLIGTATAASAAEADTYADIYVSLDLPTIGSGPAEFEAIGVLVGAGPELTWDGNLFANPSNWEGDLEVDIDLETMTITVTGGADPWDFQEAYVSVELSGGTVLDTVELTEDTLFGGASWLQSYGVEAGVFDAYWATCDFTAEVVDEVCDSLDLDGVTSFVFDIEVPDTEVPDTEPEPEPEPEPEGGVDDAGAAVPVVATPTFTG